MPDVRFEGRVAVVTGAGRGLGREHALLLAARGAAVVVNDLGVGNTGSAAKVVDVIAQHGGSAVACEADVATGDGARAVVAAALETFGRVDIVINNAGILRSCDFAELGEELFDVVLAANLRSTYLVTRAAWQPMCQQRYGRVVSTTSNSGLLGAAGSVAYAAAKAGVWGLTRSLALEGVHHGINVNAVAPIAFTTMSATSRLAPPSWRTGQGDEWAARLDAALVAPAVAWLSCQDCTTNGQVLSVAGGRVARFALGLNDGFVDEQLTIESVRDHCDELFADDSFEVLAQASEEGKRLHRRLLGKR